MRELKEVFRRYRSQPIERVISLINPMLRGWVNYFAVGHSSECFSYINDWVEKKVRRHMVHARKRTASAWCASLDGDVARLAHRCCFCQRRAHRLSGPSQCLPHRGGLNLNRRRSLMTLNIPLEFVRAFEGVDPDTERKCMSFLADVRSRYNEMRDQLDEREYDNEQLGKKISQLRELLARVRDELGKQISLLSPDVRNAIDNELWSPPS